MSSKILTVYILTYNRPDYLAQCLSSIENQIFKDFNVVVLDNASEKDGQYLLENFPSLSIEYIKHPSNLGSVGNIEYALRHKSGTKYKILFHDDDLMHPSLLAEEVKFLEFDPRVTWVGTALQPFFGIPGPFKKINAFDHLVFSKNEIATKLMKGAPLAFCSVMYRADQILMENFASLIERCSIIFDRPFLLDQLKVGLAGYIPQELVTYRQHANQDSHTGPLQEDNLIALAQAYRATFEENWTKAQSNFFYSWTGFELRDSFFRLAPSKRTNLNIFLGKAVQKGVYDPAFSLAYPIGLLKRQLARAKRVLPKVRERLRNGLARVNE